MARSRTKSRNCWITTVQCGVRSMLPLAGVVLAAAGCDRILGLREVRHDEPATDVIYIGDTRYFETVVGIASSEDDALQDGTTKRSPPQ